MSSYPAYDLEAIAAATGQDLGLLRRRYDYWTAPACSRMVHVGTEDKPHRPCMLAPDHDGPCDPMPPPELEVPA